MFCRLLIKHTTNASWHCRVFCLVVAAVELVPVFDASDYLNDVVAIQVMEKLQFAFCCFFGCFLF